MVTWHGFLLIQTILRYFTATKEQFVDFWMKYLNPSDQPVLAYKVVSKSLEMLARGAFTSGSTLVSKKYA